MSPNTAAPTRESEIPLVVLDGTALAVIQRFSHLIRKPHGDKVKGGRLESHAWSALKILGRIGMESDDDQEICVAAEAAERVVDVISDALRTAKSSPSATIHQHHRHRLCPSRRDIELAQIALVVGKKFWVPLVDGQYSSTGGLEHTLLRTFFLSPKRSHVLYLEFQVLSERFDQSPLSSQVPKSIIELEDSQISLAQDIEAKGITIDESED